MNKIEETKAYLIKEHGEPVDKIVDGRRYRYENVELQNFEKLLQLLDKASEIVNFELTETHKNAICDFVRYENPMDVEIVIDKLQSMIKQWNKKVGFLRGNFKKMFNKIEEDVTGLKYNPKNVMSYFVEYLRCSQYSNKATYRSLM